MHAYSYVVQCSQLISNCSRVLHVFIYFLMINSISFSLSLQTFTKKHGIKARSHGIPSLHQNIHAPKFYQCSTSKCQMQPMFTKRSPLVAALGGTNNGAQQPNSVHSSPLLDLVDKFYAHLNAKDVRRLEKLFDPSCVIEDESYYTPLEGKNVYKFFEKLTTAMGQHVVFAVDRICEGNDSSIVVMWHLEWNGDIIPFTKGCSFYTCSKNNGAFLIRRAYVFVEAPLKPGDLALDMLTIIISIFDRFPNLAESFLRKPDAFVFYMLKVYKFIVEPLMLPVLMYYTRMMTYAASVLANVVAIMNSILKLFF